MKYIFLLLCLPCFLLAFADLGVTLLDDSDGAELNFHSVRSFFIHYFPGSISESNLFIDRYSDDTIRSLYRWILEQTNYIFFGLLGFIFLLVAAFFSRPKAKRYT